jgi:flagellar biosynthesis chaperone FliJ
MSNGSDEKKYTPRFAKTVEELVFYTDTKDSDYPVYLLPSYEVRLKKRPNDVEKFATFHFKSIEAVEKCDPERNIIVDLLADAEKNMTIDDYVKSYPQLPLSAIVKTIQDLGASLHIRTFKLAYEVYKGDYEEFVTEAPATVVMLYIVPPYGLRSTTTDQKFAISYATLKRMLSKLPPDVSSIVQRITYVDKLSTHKYILPIIKIKFCIPSQELVNAFDIIKKWLKGLEGKVEDATDAVGETEVEVEELERKLKEVEGESERSIEIIPPVQTVQTTTAQQVVKCDEEEYEKLVKEVEELREIVEKRFDDWARRQGLVKVKLVIFTLPTEYLGSETKYSKDESGKIVESKVLSVDPTRARSLRKKFYDVLHTVAYKIHDMWALRHDADLSLLNEVIDNINEEFKGLLVGSRTIELVDAYFPKDYVTRMLSQYIEEREASMKEIYEKLNKVEKAKEKARLLRELEELKAEIEKLQRELRYLSSL